MKTLATTLLLALAGLYVHAQTGSGSTDSSTIRRIFDEALLRGHAYQNLEYLTTRIGGRLSGSPQAAAAVDWSYNLMLSYGFDSVYLQPVMVPHWVRGNNEQGVLLSGNQGPELQLHLTAIGNSVGTPAGGITAEVIEVQTLAELESLGKAKVAGKIVFFNRPFDATLISTSAAYGKAGDQRRAGPSAAAKLGALGVVIRSLSTGIDHEPHTGALRYEEGVQQIPGAALGTLDADALSAALKQNPARKLFLQLSCEMLPDVLSYNVIAETRGSTNPEEIILVGGHLDAWDNGQGAHDDGAGCMHALEALRLFKALGMKPKRTLRCVLFMNEENGLRGGQAYADSAKAKGEKHIAAIESDAGGFTPRGFGMSSTAAAYKQLLSWKPLLSPYGLHDLLPSGGGADIGPLRDQGPALIGFLPDGQRYFDYHHTRIDTFDKVNRRELELGCASIAALIYLIDTYGIPN